MAPENDLQNAPIEVVTPNREVARLRRRRALRSLLIALTVIVIMLWAIGVFGGNVHTVVPGAIYRSAQLTGSNYTAVTAAMIGDDLDSVLKRDHIKTVLNLRGGSDANDYYRAEVEECGRLGVDHVDISLSATHLPPPDKMRRLLWTFDHARYPLLLHCQAGADRTGLVSAVYAALYKQESVDKAVHDELTWRYGHVSFSKTRAMDRFFALYRQTNHGLPLRQWIEQVYPTIYTSETGIALPQHSTH